LLLRALADPAEICLGPSFISSPLKRGFFSRIFGGVGRNGKESASPRRSIIIFVIDSANDHLSETKAVIREAMREGYEVLVDMSDRDKTFPLLKSRPVAHRNVIFRKIEYMDALKA
jgi:hypothetical protein